MIKPHSGLSDLEYKNGGVEIQHSKKRLSV